MTLDSTGSPERSLWAAVLLRALSDIGYESPRGSKSQLTMATNREKEDAIAWISTRKKDVLLVCDMAGIHPDWLKKTATKIMNGNTSVASVVRMFSVRKNLKTHHTYGKKRDR